MKLHRRKDTTLSDREFASLLRDKTFVDYLNVFLNLPIFSQRLLYKFSENDFDFDPPLRRTQMDLDRRRLVQWLLSERIPLFLRTDLYLEYTLCRQLLQTELKLRPSSHDNNYDDERIKRDSTFLRQMIGHVTGMRKFREFLEGSAGQKVLQFWLDAEHFWKLPARSEDRRRNLFRDIQAKYFRNGGVLELPDNEKWRAFTKAITFEDITSTANLSTCHIGGTDIPGRLRSGAIYGGQKELLAKSVFQRMQNTMLNLIKSYWLPKYIIHCRHETSNGGLDLSKYPDVDKLDLLNIGDPDVIELLGDLEKKHDHTKVILPEDELSKERAKVLKMNAMFPHFKEESPSYDGIFKTEEVTKTASELKPGLDWVTSSCETVGSDNMSQTQSEVANEESETEELESLDSWLYKSRLSSPVGGVGGAAQKEERRQSFPVQTTGSPEAKMRKYSTPMTPTLHPSVNVPSLSVNTRPEGQSISPAHSLKREVTSSNSIAAKLTEKNLNIYRVHGRHPTLPKTQELPLGVGFETEAKRSKQKVFNWLKKSSESVRLSGTKLTSSLPKMVLSPSSQSRPVTSGDKMTTSSHKSLTSYGRICRPHTTTIRGMLQSKLATCQSRNNLGSDDSVNLDTYYFGVFCYRRNNAVFVAAIAADQLAGHPFERFLKTNKLTSALNYLHFWQDAQMYLTTKPSELDNLGEFLKLRRAKILLLKYLHPCGENRIDIGKTLCSKLTELLPLDEGDDILRHTQDVVCQVLRNQWRTFVSTDTDSFLEAQVPRKERKSTTPATRLTNIDDVTHSLDVSQALKDAVLQSHQIERPRSRIQRDHAGLLEERMFWALQLAQHVSHLNEEELSLGGAMEAFSEDDDFGSLKVSKPETVRNKAIRDYIFPPKIDIEKIKVSEFKSQEVKKKTATTEFPTGPAMGYLYIQYPFLKPIRRNGVMIERPFEKPKCFSDLLRDPHHTEFLKRFLQREGNDAPIVFWLAVDDLRKTKSGKGRQLKVLQIVKTFFGKSAGKGVALCCDADIIKEIPNVTKVTPSMLISAQVCVAKSIEERWWDLYGETFPKEQPVANKDDPLAQLVEQQQQQADAPRKWNKKKTKTLWIHFVRSVTSFRRGFLNQFTANMFKEFLKTEVSKDTEKKPGSIPQTQPGLQTNIAIKRIIKNRIVSVDKLPADLKFLIEVDRFRVLADTVMTQAQDGQYNHKAEQLVAQKAKAIIECFLESEIPPKLQVNISNDVAEAIIFNHRNELIERGLFHDATIIIFPTLAHLWKKFSAQCLTSLPSPMKTPRQRRLTPHASRKVPDYITMEKVKSKRIVAHHGDEDCQKILFSLAHGVRHILPPSKDDLLASATKSVTGSQLGVGHFPPGFGLHPGDSESLLGRLTGIATRATNGHMDEFSPDLPQIVHQRSNSLRKNSFLPNLGARRQSRVVHVERVMERSNVDLQAPNNGGVILANLLKFINPDALQLT